MGTRVNHDGYGLRRRRKKKKKKQSETESREQTNMTIGPARHAGYTDETERRREKKKKKKRLADVF